VLKHDATNDSLMVWLEQERTKNLFAGFGFHSVVTLNDDDGNEFIQTTISSRATVSTNVICGFLFPIPPQTSGRLRIRVPFGQAFLMASHHAEFLVDNPAPRRPASWQARAFPVSARVEDLQMTLTGLSPCERATAGGSGLISEQWMRAIYHFDEGGRPTTNWQLCSVEVFGESGGNYRPAAFSRRSDVAENHLEFKAGLSVKSVWKLRFAVCRVGGFATNEVWNARGVPLEGMERANFTPMSNSFAGVALTIYDVPTGRPRRLETYLSPPDESYAVVLVKAVDHHGQRIDGWTAGPVPIIYPGGRGRFSFPLQTVSNSYSADVTFGVAPLRYVEMLVRPGSAANPPSTFPALGK
jgi:hypothetical protein